MHKMIHCNSKSLDRRYNKLIFMLNLPSIALALALFIISRFIMLTMEVPDDLYRAFFLVLYITAAYSFIVTTAAVITTNTRLKGHKKYTYIELLGQQMVISQYISTVYENGRFRDYRRLSLIELADVQEVVCIRNKVIIKGKARRFECRADWLDYEYTDLGKIDFDYWWFGDNGGTEVQTTEFEDVYVFIERIAQRIIFCSERQKAREIRRAEFRERMLRAAGRSREERRKKPKERVFRGYEPDMERKF